MRKRIRSRRNVSSWTDISDFKDIHSGSKCFIVGAGPSLKDLDLKNIHTNNNIVISVNSSIILMPWKNEENQERRFWISTDVLTTKWNYFWNHVLKSHCTKLVRSTWKSEIERIKGWDFRFFSTRKKTECQEEEDGLLFGTSSAVAALDFALYSGCKKISLLGIDHKMLNDKSHFWQFLPKPKRPQRTDKKGEYSPNQEQQKRIFQNNISSFSALKKHSENIGAEVSNCNPKSELSVFHSLSLDDACCAI